MFTRVASRGTRYVAVGLALVPLLLLSMSMASAQGLSPQAAVGTAFTYQGYLTTANAPVEGSCDLQFSLWNDAVAGTQSGSTLDQPAIPVSEGRFTVQLDFGNVFDGAAYWLQVAVRCPAGTGSYTALTPRQRLTAAPYAQNVPWSGISGMPAGFADNVDNDTLYGAGPGLILSGGANGPMTLTVNFAGTGGATTVARSDHDHWGQSWTGNGVGLALAGGTVAFSGTGSLYGLYGTSGSTAGIGVSGWVSATSGNTYGVFGQADSNTGAGVGGRATANTGVAYGVFGTVDSANGIGVFGQADSASCDPGMPGDPCQGVGGKSSEGYGVRGETADGVALGGYMTGSGTGLNLLSGGTGYFITAGNYFPANTRFSVDASGNVKADGSFTSPAADVAEMFPAESGLEPGDVLVIGLDGKLARSTQAYQGTVVGVYSTQPAFVGGAPDDGETAAGQVPLAIVGRVPVKISAENGSIRPGDLLVASATPGHAMRAGANPTVGSIIGKALAGWDQGAGVIQMLVTLQ